MYIPILKKQESYSDMKAKLEEEFNELKEAITNYVIYGKPNNAEEVCEETFDVIQVCIGVLDSLEREGTNIDEASMKHLLKLICRHWEIKKMIKVEVL